MKKIYYEKIGRRYRPVAEYDSDLLDSFHRGSHLVMCYPGGSSRRFNVEPNHAAMIAAGRVAEDAICKALNQASEMRPAKTPITPAQQRAWKKLAKEFGDELCTLHGTSVRDIAEAGVQAMQTEATYLMSHPAVVDAWEKFMLTCKLTKERKNGNS
jgi:hypothetical protein